MPFVILMLTVPLVLPMVIDRLLVRPTAPTPGIGTAAPPQHQDVSQSVSMSQNCVPMLIGSFFPLMNPVRSAQQKTHSKYLKNTIPFIKTFVGSLTQPCFSKIGRETVHWMFSGME